MSLPLLPPFRQRLASGQPLLGTFVKSPGAHGIEVLGEVGLDFVVIDAEHAPWDRGAVDLALLAARAHALPALVRVENSAGILSALDSGATGVLVPHVSHPDTARAVVAACRYRPGQRGFSNSPRAGRYGGLGLAAHLDASDTATTVVAMLEDAEALDHAEALAAVEGIDAFFLGRGDLTVALGETSTEAETVRRAVALLVAAVRAAGKPLCAFVGKTSEIPALQALGVTAFILSSDQGLLRHAASTELAQFKALPA
ncbi:HpcH/HpaI aldolase family protein [Hydrogenophaga sp. OTU3427]|uniref:HpcH/HpaI aldolase family protein n=1 Tax=Hydrogenophaga sp. OTU3427 TaxID=3043856 RepID=UPI00313C3D9D